MEMIYFYRKKRARMKASITVEAVFIIPVLMLFFLMILWFSFALHDRAIVEGAISEMLEEGSEYMVYGTLPGVGVIEQEKGSRSSLRYAFADATYEELKQWEKSLARNTKRKLYLYQIAGFSCDKVGGKVRVYAKYCCTKFFPAKWWGLSKLFYIEYNSERFCPVREEVTRVGSVLLDLYGEITEQ